MAGTSRISWREQSCNEVNGVTHRRGTLLVPVPGLSGTVYPPGTSVAVTGRGANVDGFVDGDWLPLSWWEFAEGVQEAAPEA
jgi:hypothetical protein